MTGKYLTLLLFKKYKKKPAHAKAGFFQNVNIHNQLQPLGGEAFFILDFFMLVMFAIFQILILSNIIFNLNLVKYFLNNLEGFL